MKLANPHDPLERLTKHAVDLGGEAFVLPRRLPDPLPWKCGSSIHVHSSELRKMCDGEPKDERCYCATRYGRKREQVKGKGGSRAGKMKARKTALSVSRGKGKE